MTRNRINLPPLPPVPPEDPVRLLSDWLTDAARHSAQRHANAMTLATVDAAGQPSARVVLMKDLSLEHGYAVFHTHYRSRKGLDLAACPRAAAVLHWDRLGRQIRLEGATVRCPAGESDAYFATRPWQSRLNAWVSEQSRALKDPDELMRRARHKARDFDLPDPGSVEQPSISADAALVRPGFWGGFRLWFAAVEFWSEGTDRFHDRLRYERTQSRIGDDGIETGPWAWQRLQP